MKIPTDFAAFFKQAHFSELTPIQAQVYQPFLDQQSFLALAPTGSGKTLAFGMPLIQQVEAGQGIQKLILEPSQELAIQTRDVLRQLAPQLSIYAVIGGANLKRQIAQLKTKPEIVVGTLGRVSDLVQQRKLKLNRVTGVVIDEADELLSEKMDPIRALISRLDRKVQLNFFSATSAAIFSQLSQYFGREIGQFDLRGDQEFRAGLKHYFLAVPNKKKVELLQRLAHRKQKRTLVFCQSSKQLHQLAADLRYRKLYYMVLDTSDPKRRREEALRSLRQHQTSLLLTTDVAARGMDIPDLTTVINWENPQTATAYTHRSGRTGRMGRAGEVITLGNQHDYRQLQTLLRPQAITVKWAQLQAGKLQAVAKFPQKKGAPVKSQSSTKNKSRRSPKK
ncbi:DEAD/DEAH box helicase [Lactobacillus sp. DCY120]|uniref:DEAD/DEAH box helicase n=1 Tax=Bombilactobacillus apium TaxID=2675299 RepID=A0A850R316_9LACO|nr:DEAD/DEAH box helicase [Bombilactobacillus apium]NVY96750.1 DEAD/DEAH box helicase [Bombilactobacillus apium]